MFYRKSLRILMLISFFVGMFVILSSCEYDTEPVLKVVKRYGFYDNNGNYRYIISVKNSGEKPAYAVIAIGEAFIGDDKIDYDERTIGDIFNGVTISDTLTFEKLGYQIPDTVVIKLVYTPFY